MFYLYYANPLAGISEAYRSVLFDGQAPQATTFVMAIVGTTLLSAWGMRSFWIHEKEFADLI